MSSTRKALKDWSESTNDRTKVQHIYLLLTAGLIILAGLVSLLNPELGRLIVGMALATLVIFAANGVIWSLLYTFLHPQEVPKSIKKRR